MTGPLVLVLDDDEAMRDALEFQLGAADYQVRGYMSAEALVEERLPDDAACLVADVRLGNGIDGVSLLERLRRGGELMPVIIMTGHGDIPLAVRAMRAGAFHFLEKPFSPEHMMEVVAEAVASRLQRSATEDLRQRAVDRIARLSPREREVLAGLAAGKSNKVMGYDLGISTRTVEGHRALVMEKLGVRTMAEAVRIALMTEMEGLAAAPN